jgi:hypothetical protein
MTEKSRRQGILLGVLAIVLVGVLVWTMGGGEEDPASSPAAPSNPARRATAGAANTDVVELKLEALKGQREELREAERNPFRFRPKPPPPPPAVTRPLARPDVVAAPVPTGPPPPPPIPLRFIGFVDAAGPTGRVGILSDGRGNVFQGKEGDIIEGRYRVLRVGTDSAELVYLDGRGRQTIRLSGQ